MHTLLVLIHITAMIASIGFMSGALFQGLLGKNAAVRTASAGMVATAMGAITGVILLFSAPLMTQCVILTTYLSGVTALYVFGFGGGFVDRARLIRRSASIQKR